MQETRKVDGSIADRAFDDARHAQFAEKVFLMVMSSDDTGTRVRDLARRSGLTGFETRAVLLRYFDRLARECEIDESEAGGRMPRPRRRPVRR